jgi:hypothetical protein
MANETSSPIISREDYEAIEAAVMETARGRWFLAEYARRNRHADTGVLLEAIARLEKRLGADFGSTGTLHLQRELTDMAETISQTKLDLAHSIVEAGGLVADPQPEQVFEDVVHASEKADKAVLNAAEHVQEIAWALREGADDGRAIEDLDRQALEIYRASSQHSLTTNRVRSIVGVLRQMETRLESIVGSWKADLAFVDPSAGATMRGSTHDRPGDPETILETAPPRIRSDITFAEAPRIVDRRRPMDPVPIRPGSSFAPAMRPPEVPVAPAPAPVPLVDNPFAEIDALPDRRKLAMFV